MKGLEPEIQRLIAKHNAEIKKLKSIHEAELLASDERAGRECPPKNMILKFCCCCWYLLFLNYNI